jgi:sRNA-binding regulator protein Hfq
LSHWGSTDQIIALCAPAIKQSARTLFPRINKTQTKIYFKNQLDLKGMVIANNEMTFLLTSDGQHSKVQHI